VGGNEQTTYFFSGSNALKKPKVDKIPIYLLPVSQPFVAINAIIRTD